MSDIVFCRTWTNVEPKEYYNPVTSLLVDNKLSWRGMRTVSEIRRAQALAVPQKRDSAYRPIERYVLPTDTFILFLNFLIFFSIFFTFFSQFFCLFCCRINVFMYSRLNINQHNKNKYHLDCHLDCDLETGFPGNSTRCGCRPSWSRNCHLHLNLNTKRSV